MPWDEKKVPPTETLAVGGSNETKTQDTKPNVDVKATDTCEEAIKYLDGNKVWSKSKMEDYPVLQGLFEDMNNFNLSNLINIWYPKLKRSRNFENIYNSAKKAENKNPKQGSHTPTYNRRNDEKINLTNYTKWLDHVSTDTGGGSNSGKEAGKPKKKNLACQIHRQVQVQKEQTIL